MDVSLGCTLTYKLKSAVPFVFNVEAQECEGQLIRAEALTVTPDVPVERWTMPESGNRYLRVLAPPGELTLHYEATVGLTPALDHPSEVATIPIGALPFPVLSHLYPSRYCQSDRLMRFAERTFGRGPEGYAKANGICNWIHDNVDYIRGSSDALTSAFDTVSQRAGVCRDFAHLAIALCRAQGIPARYVSAYAWRLQPPDFHAVIEAFLNGPNGPAWYRFDATRMAAPSGLVRIGIGRDAAEVAFCSIYGEAEAAPPQVWIAPVGEEADPMTVMAVRADRGS